ncbi:bifunctional diaminohydroxyphosphoribosylaminopyrimidine deaminase/5-amino-6-(5-phosphoribosylamino)uracil reductase RibD [Helicobacter sp. 11S03491-1]|uniref:bifunctional diaminohydroxyphosphoribosylaminopyrimidine deaminase/5-amino-6-(5-phosphoribosylamino)uracil reductase RibD n=1 Tax=Helicobacter sp. 11S03491-1 TaxID=1476196 RepID=UPI000BA74414|nr:bifunctional diaminohydroxyphosphoribosylaminopyrimidine deaminase/5-amino-6-(5-phosphoribosylamino)uracil reductase RibD [Helicobacter sp. 11S03491-1]PAF42967.1 riboflavin biosynthesis protein RibD [Helicobacter sp. 11S03491-1]
MNSDEELLSLCIQEAWRYQSLTLPNPAVGAMVLGEGGEILSIRAHTRSGYAHAEINALKDAYEVLSGKVCPFSQSQDIHHYLQHHHQGIFEKCSIYVTLEPCNHYGKTPPCAELLENIRPKKIVIGALERQGEAHGGSQRLKKAGINVECGVLESGCEDLLYPFLCLRQKGHFNLFKIAQRLNGDYQSGKISGRESIEFTHNQRSIANTMIISGKTAREDKPILDARYGLEIYGKKAPNIKILSTHKKFDSSIPLFHVHERHVQICSEPSELGLDCGFNLIEGGWKLFETLSSFVDMVLIHISPTIISNSANNGFFWQGKMLHTQKLGDDGLIWIKKF